MIAADVLTLLPRRSTLAQLVAGRRPALPRRQPLIVDAVCELLVLHRDHRDAAADLALEGLPEKDLRAAVATTVITAADIAENIARIDQEVDRRLHVIGADLIGEISNPLTVAVHTETIGSILSRIARLATEVLDHGDSTVHLPAALELEALPSVMRPYVTSSLAVAADLPTRSL